MKENVYLGLLHFRRLVETPVPHDREHSPHVPQELHPPSRFTNTEVLFTQLPYIHHCNVNKVIALYWTNKQRHRQSVYVYIYIEIDIRTDRQTDNMLKFKKTFIYQLIYYQTYMQMKTIMYTSAHLPFSTFCACRWWAHSCSTEMLPFYLTPQLLA